MGRAPCCDKVGLKKGPWTPEEDHILVSFIQQHGHSNWRALPRQAGLLRCGKSCRLRWMNYLRPDIKRGNFTKQEEETIIHLHQIMGNRWSAIAARLPGRTDNEIKNVWHTHLKKKLDKQNQTTKSEPHISTNAQKNFTHANNNYMTTTTSNETTTSDPQQSYSTSDDFSSFNNEVSSMQVLNNTINNDQSLNTRQSDMDYNFPVIDESFWSYQGFDHHDATYDMTSMLINDENQWQDHDFLKMSNASNAWNNSSSSSICNGNIGMKNFGDNTDFWFDVFLQANGGVPELPEF